MNWDKKIAHIHTLLQSSTLPLTAHQIGELSGERPENVAIALNTLIVLGEVDKGHQDVFGRPTEVYKAKRNAETKH